MVLGNFFFASLNIKKIVFFFYHKENRVKSQFSGIQYDDISNNFCVLTSFNRNWTTNGT